MTLRNVPSFDGPHAQTSPLHQVGDSFLSVFSKRWARDPGCFSSMNREWGGGRDRYDRLEPQKSWLIQLAWTLSAPEAGLRARGWMRTPWCSKQGSRPLNKPFPRAAGLLRRSRIHAASAFISSCREAGPVGGSLLRNITQISTVARSTDASGSFLLIFYFFCLGWLETSYVHVATYCVSLYVHAQPPCFVVWSTSVWNNAPHKAQSVFVLFANVDGAFWVIEFSFPPLRTSQFHSMTLSLATAK